MSGVNGAGTAAERLASVKHLVDESSRSAGRQPNDVRVLAVSKTHGATAIAAMYEAGQRAFGENYAQEFVAKCDDPKLASLPGLTWHFIGHLQSNKVRDVALRAHALHSLDRLSLLDALEKHRPPALPKLEVFLQLEVDAQDENKHGATAEVAARLAERLARSDRLHWVGFMGMGPADADDERLRVLYERFVQQGKSLWKAHHPDAATLSPAFSLGMSGDLGPAIAAGSTLVRVGTALFGARGQR